MTAVTLPGTNNAVLQSVLRTLVAERYTNAKKISGSGIVSGGHEGIDPSTETYVGQMRWKKPLKPVINRQSLTDPTAGVKTTQGQGVLTYVKSARSHGAGKVNAEALITQEDSLQKISTDLVETQAQDEHNALISIIRGVAISEALRGTKAGGGQTFENDVESGDFGFYVDLGAKKLVGDASAANQGAQRAEALLQALGMGFKDYEPPYVYAMTTPEVMASYRAANLVDSDKITDGSIEFETLFQGKIRLILTRANQGLTAGELAVLNGQEGVNLVGTKMSSLILPGALSLTPMAMPKPVEIDTNASAFGGAGTEELWFRWGYIAHPAGYNWAGSQDEFAMDADYQSIVMADGTLRPLLGATPADVSRGVWERKVTSVLNLGILPVFHS